MSRPTGVLETLRGLDSYHFEQLIADIWQECQGWTTEVQQQSRDNGVDVVGEPPGRGTSKTALQAKCNAAGNKIGRPKIQQYSALRHQYEDAWGVTVVTTSSFSQPALELAEHLDVRCIDGRDLVRIIQREDAMEIVEWYAAGKPEDW